MIYTLENEFLVCEVDSHGAELKSIKGKYTGEEYLWNGDPEYWNRTSPVLFPFVGAVKDKEYRHDGKTYTIGQHGFARDMEFYVKSSSEKEIWMGLRESEETLEKYPFKFHLNIGYRLLNGSVTVMWRVKNTNDGEMFFAIGAHPGFAISKLKDYSFMLYDIDHKPVSSIKNRVFGAGGCVTDEFSVIETPEGKLPMDEHLFDGDALVLEGRQLGRVALVRNDDDKPSLFVDFDSPLVGLWSPPHRNAPFVCIEPWYGRCDSENFDGELAEREYEQKLDAGAEFNASYRIFV